VSIQVAVVLPFRKETPGALLYALPDQRNTIASSLYIRKDQLRAAGYSGAWPIQITVTVEVQ
jgi:hypothetical protein